jgi:hypothetical protein
VGENPVFLILESEISEFSSHIFVIPVLARRSASARRRENGNPDPVPAQAGNQHLKKHGFPASSAGQALLDFIPVKTGAGMT